MNYKILLEEVIGVAKGGFSGVTAGIWMAIAFVVYNTYSKGLNVTPLDLKLIIPFALICAGVTFIYNAILNIRELRKSRKDLK